MAQKRDLNDDATNLADAKELVDMAHGEFLVAIQQNNAVSRTDVAKLKDALDDYTSAIPRATPKRRK